MKYYVIAGEASGDLHASELMKSIARRDRNAQFRCIGGDLMQRAGGHIAIHYSQMAYMGFVPVLLHLHVILRNMLHARKDILSYRPDSVILVDYAGFNLRIAKYLKRKNIRTYYYISPKIWAWNQWRIKTIKRCVDQMFCILPFESDFYKKHDYSAKYVGNPTAHEVKTFRKNYHECKTDFALRHHLPHEKPIIALLAGSRRQEIKDNLPSMLAAAAPFAQTHQLVLACAPGIAQEYYDQILRRCPEATLLHRVLDDTYSLLSHSGAALVTSGTATLETALFGVPQVVCYKTPLPRIVRWAFDHIMSCKYISLVNLIANKEIVPELFADRFSVKNIYCHLYSILNHIHVQEKMIQGYRTVCEALTETEAPEQTAQYITELLGNTSQH